MRLKGFILFIFGFTVVYILFWTIVDYLKREKIKDTKLSVAATVLNPDIFVKFANFYGISKTYTKEFLSSIYIEVEPLSDISISYVCDKYKISEYELVVIVLYLEYTKLISRKDIFMDSNIIRSSKEESNEFYDKYSEFFANQATFQDIEASVGKSAWDDLSKIERFFMFPGVRFVDSTIYYLGVSNEKKEN